MTTNKFKYGLKNSQIEEIITELNAFDLTEIILFGSQSRGNFRDNSDVDLALIGNLTFLQITRIKAILEEETSLPYFFDVVEYNSLTNMELKNQIDQNGKILCKSGKK